MELRLALTDRDVFFFSIVEDTLIPHFPLREYEINNIIYIF